MTFFEKKKEILSENTSLSKFDEIFGEEEVRYFQIKTVGGKRTFEYSRNSNKYLIEISDGTIAEIIDFFVGSVVIN